MANYIVDYYLAKPVVDLCLCLSDEAYVADLFIMLFINVLFNKVER